MTPGPCLVRSRGLRDDQSRSAIERHGCRPAATADAVQVRGIGKRFPGVIANHDVDITIRSGTVHALIGENGAGKSTLMKILYGVQKPDDGTLTVNGEEVSFASPTDAIAHGIGMVFQHFMLADNLTVLENVVLGAEKLHGIGDEARDQDPSRSPSAYGFGLDPDELVEDLGVGERQRVEILKVLYRGAKIIILDEPTAVLVPQEVDALFDNLRELKAEGHTILFISHKLDEVLAIADDITVMRRGTTVGEAQPETRDQAPARRADGRLRAARRPRPRSRRSPTRCCSRSATSRSPTSSAATCSADIDLTIHRGEVLGIAGVEGNGQAELVETIMGMRKPDRRHDLRRRQGHHRLGHPRAARGRHRLHPRGPAPARPAARRAALGEPRSSGFQSRDARDQGLPDQPRRRPQGHRADRRASTTSARPGIDTPARALSGGNQQKLIVGREMSGDPVLLIAAHPTRGVDVGAQAAIWDHIKKARREGLAVLLISADLDELIGLSDRIEVILRGRLVGEFDPQDRHPAGPRLRR